MQTFRSSRLSNGNALFPSEVIIEDTYVMFRKPGVIAATEKTFKYNKISSIEVSSPFIGFSKVKICSIGLDSMLIEGLERAEAEEIRRLIEINMR